MNTATPLETYFESHRPKERSFCTGRFLERKNSLCVSRPLVSFLCFAFAAMKSEHSVTLPIHESIEMHSDSEFHCVMCLMVLRLMRNAASVPQYIYYP